MVGAARAPPAISLSVQSATVTVLKAWLVQFMKSDDFRDRGASPSSTEGP